MYPLTPERRGLGGIGLRPFTTWWWMGGAFVVAFAFAAIVLSIFGGDSRGTVLALRVTARWSFVLFWFAYAGGAIAALCGPPLNTLTRFGREFGLAFAAAQLVHVGLVLWLVHITPGPNSAMLFFWVAILCACLLALFSVPQFRDKLGQRLWRTLCTIALEYIALAFAADFILNPLRSEGLDRYPLTYLPFALMLVAGFGLRVAAVMRHHRARVWERRSQGAI
jgi:hypothetical protein